MSCTATRRNIVLALALGATYAFSAAPVQAQSEAAAGDASMTRSADQDLAREDARRYSFEVKALPLLLTLMPNSVGFGGEFEVRMTDRLSVFTDITHMRLSLSDEMVKDLQEDQSSKESIPQNTQTTAVSLGARYYGNILDDSWYTGAKFGGGTTHVQWAYGDERLVDDSFAYRTGLEAGYRWLWDSGFHVRLGGGLTAISTPRRSITTAMTQTGESFEDAKKDVEKKSPSDGTRFGTTVDLGLGWTF